MVQNWKFEQKKVKDLEPGHSLRVAVLDLEHRAWVVGGSEFVTGWTVVLHKWILCCVPTITLCHYQLGHLVIDASAAISKGPRRGEL